MRRKGVDSVEISGLEIPFEVVRRFYEKIKVLPGDECWWWTGAKDRKGYGIFVSPLNKHTSKAHRFSYWIIRGPFFDEDEIDHLCLNPSCVNPYHMEVVSKSENTARGNRTRHLRKKVVEVSLEDLLDEI